MKAKKLLVAMVAGAGMTAALPASALSIGADFDGFVTMLTPKGGMFNNGDLFDVPPYFGYRTPVKGKVVFNIGLTGLSGSATFEPFQFAGLTASGRNINFKPVSTILGIVPTNTLLLGNMLFDFGPIVGIPVSLVLDIGNLTTALMASSLSGIVGGIMVSPTENTIVTFEDGTKRTLPMGLNVVTTTTWNTTDVDTDKNGVPGPVNFETNPSGTTPLIVDTVVDITNGDIGLGGSPLKVNVFANHSPNFDFKKLKINCINLLGSCSTGGIPLPPLTINPDPLAPLLGGLSKLLKGLGL